MAETADLRESPSASDREPHSTTSLLREIRQGDRSARDLLIGRYWGRLSRWARGRIPAGIRDPDQTDDLVQITFLRALERMEQFDNRRDGAFLAYLRTVFLNLVRDTIRRRSRRPKRGPLNEAAMSLEQSPLDRAIGRQMVERYERALLTLDDEVREAVIMKVEMEFSYPEIAAAQGIDKPNTVRMRVERALAKLAERLNEAASQ
ncbi:MAG TPA: sigma-70 family RNA polymerase sigma factor [Candidatus Saccharimonadales bacterium]|nr:sigma-70 family RNA polymerase sigma factor [Candidatus Saccharimonadales bacterium]